MNSGKVSARELYALGKLHEKQRRWDDAGAAYEAALAKDDRRAAWHLRLGTVRERQRNVAAAASAYETALARNGALPGLNQRLETLRTVISQWSGADTIYKSVVGVSHMLEDEYRVERDVLYIKLGRTPPRVVSRVQVFADGAPRLSLIEKLLLRNASPASAASDLRTVPELYFLTKATAKSSSIEIPEILHLSHSADGILVLQKDLLDERLETFKPVQIEYSVENMRPIVQALALFNTQTEFEDKPDVRFRIDNRRNRTFLPDERKVEKWRSLQPPADRNDGTTGLTILIDRFLARHRDILAQLIETNGLVVCHGDPAPGNMFRNSAGIFGFIDFERFCLAPPGFDLGLFFVFLLRALFANMHPRPPAHDIVHFCDQLTDIYIEQFALDRKDVSPVAVRAACASALALGLLSPPRLLYRQLFKKNAFEENQDIAWHVLRTALDRALAASAR